ncbi:MAG: hypothetical protein JW915_13985 [Chitinispirillaceae bacterium]|nr:hypothetical protein [Chitinispirillaceae bacterium]
MSSYSMLEVREPKSRKRATIGKLPDLSNINSTGFLNWFSGSLMNIKIPEPLEFKLEEKGGDYITDFFPPSIPLMSKKMLQALNTAGVDNIESFKAILIDRAGNPVPEEFFAVNIIGRISCADLDASECEVDDPDDPVGVSFDSLVIDEERTHGALFFRLHEAVNGIVVHNSVRKAIEPLQLRGISFVNPEDWIG